MFILECNIVWRFVKCYVVLADLKSSVFGLEVKSSRKAFMFIGSVIVSI